MLSLIKLCWEPNTYIFLLLNNTERGFQKKKRKKRRKEKQREREKK